MDALDLLTDADLTALAEALRTGRLHSPFTAVSVHRYCPPGHAAALAALLERLDQEEMRPGHVALLAETIARMRGSAAREDDIVDLVWTGPETLGVTNRDTVVVVRELFGSAESEVLVAGFAIHQGRTVFKRLAERMEERPGLRVRLFLDVHRQATDSSLSEEILRRFAHRFRTQDWPGATLPEVYYDPRSLDADAVQRSSLHAKCLVVDRKVAFVTSANFTEAAQKRNIEVGVLLRSEPFARQLAWHFDALADAGLLREMSFPAGET